MELMVNVADTDFDQKSVIIHEAPEEEYPDFVGQHGRVDVAAGEVDCLQESPYDGLF